MAESVESRAQAGAPAAALRQGGRRVRVRTRVATRWVAVAGQMVTLLAVSEGLGVVLPMTAAMVVVACSALVNVAVHLRRSLAGWHTEREAAYFLGYDILQLSVLLYLTGGLANPFALLILVPVTISATILELRSTVLLGVLGLASASVLTHFHLPLPWPGGSELRLPPLYMLGAWASITLCMLLLMAYAWRVADEARRMSQALAETQLALAREQELSSLGGLAAAAAHELGTPLGTIALVAQELLREHPQDGEHADDLRLLKSQAERCREILERLGQDPRGRAHLSLAPLPVAALVDSVAEPYRRESVAIRLDAAAEDDTPAPLLHRSPLLLQGLGNFIENAVDFARGEVLIRVRWNKDSLRLEIEDDGPGFATDVLGLLGDPYISTRRHRGGLGLGIFISKTLLERTGAEVRFRNRGRGRGAAVAISWPRRRLEAELGERMLPAVVKRAEHG